MKCMIGACASNNYFSTESYLAAKSQEGYDENTVDILSFCKPCEKSC